MTDLREDPAEPMHVRLDRCLSSHRASTRFAWPWIDARGRLMIGCDCGPEFHWWTRGGIAVSAALDAAGATPEDRERYAHVFGLGADPEPREMGECSREMDRILYGGTHLEGWTAPERERPADRSAEPVAAVVPAKRQTRREQRAEAEVDLFAGVGG